MANVALRLLVVAAFGVLLNACVTNDSTSAGPTTGFGGLVNGANAAWDKTAEAVSNGATAAWDKTKSVVAGDESGADEATLSATEEPAPPQMKSLAATCSTGKEAVVAKAMTQAAGTAARRTAGGLASAFIPAGGLISLFTSSAEMGVQYDQAMQQRDCATLPSIAQMCKDGDSLCDQQLDAIRQQDPPSFERACSYEELAGTSACGAIRPASYTK